MNTLPNVIPLYIRNLRTNEVLEITGLRRGVLSVPESSGTTEDEWVISGFKKV